MIVSFLFKMFWVPLVCDYSNAYFRIFSLGAWQAVKRSDLLHHPIYTIIPTAEVSFVAAVSCFRELRGAT